MKINFNNIANIKDIKSLKKYKLNKPIFLNNYLFHYLILTKNLTALKLYKFPIFKENEDGMNGFHLAAYYDNIDILQYLISKYPDYIYNKDFNEKNFMWFSSYTNNKIIDLVQKNKLDLDLLFYDFVEINDVKKNLLEMYFEISNYKIIKKILSELDLDLNRIFNEKPVFFSLLLNENLTFIQKKKIIKFIKKKKN